MQFRTRKRQEPDLEITPLIDVVFLLLLFFMVTTQFASLPGIKLTLPGIQPGNSVSATSKIEVQITAAGDIYVGGNPVNEANLAQTLRRQALDPESAVVVLMADEMLPHGKVVEVMDMIRLAGLKRVVLAAKWKHPEQKKQLYQI